MNVDWEFARLALVIFKLKMRERAWPAKSQSNVFLPTLKFSLVQWWKKSHSGFIRIVQCETFANSVASVLRDSTVKYPLALGSPLIPLRAVGDVMNRPMLNSTHFSSYVYALEEGALRVVLVFSCHVSVSEFHEPSEDDWGNLWTHSIEKILADSNEFHKGVKFLLKTTPPAPYTM